MLLDVRNLRVTFHTADGPARAVDGVSFSVDSGEVLCIVGESGCGKSATAMSVLRLYPAGLATVESDGVSFDGRDISRLSERDMRAVRGGGIGMIFQEPMTALNPVYSVGFQIGEAILAHSPKRSKAAVRSEVVRLMRDVGIADASVRYDEYPHQFSGGMRQRVLIAIAIAARPKLLIADEPTTALDVTVQAQILDLLARLRKETGMAIIWITHDLGVVAEIADEVAVMYAGQVVERAPAKELFANPMHPYTRGLLASLPKSGTPAFRERLRAIPGIVPDPRALPSGCGFHGRCFLAQKHCVDTAPLLEPKVTGHHVRCSEVRP